MLTSPPELVMLWEWGLLGVPRECCLHCGPGPVLPSALMCAWHNAECWALQLLR